MEEKAIRDLAPELKSYVDQLKKRGKGSTTARFVVSSRYSAITHADRGTPPTSWRCPA